MGLRTGLVAFAWVVLCAFQLPPHKDDLFAYPPVVEGSLDAPYALLAYDKAVHIMGRDEVPRRKAKSRYVDRSVRWSRRRAGYQGASRKLKMFEVGKARRPRVTVIYVHGRGGNRRQGVNDVIFGGNFNRLQNLLAKGRGRLLSPDVTALDRRGAADLAALVSATARRFPDTRLIVACASQGSVLCWGLAKSNAAPLVDGMIVLGGSWDYEAIPSIRFPVVFAHGTADPVYPVAKQREFFEAILNSGRPARFRAFTNGVHGTPVRVVDWRRELNWLLSQG